MRPLEDSVSDQLVILNECKSTRWMETERGMLSVGKTNGHNLSALGLNAEDWYTVGKESPGTPKRTAGTTE